MRSRKRQTEASKEVKGLQRDATSEDDDETTPD